MRNVMDEMDRTLQTYEIKIAAPVEIGRYPLR